ncbi:hypothetical protein [Nocardioides sp. AE5]|uniref:hypothetical protein n=1 Tax=Nocardioides sp. AE5 TaxID=2962573 RepID=UPI0028810B08|nr:hypothetical protein [Nocardioides sp. AE5]MDT0202051.1 hypothetical protein [Nocardioides sp. AE5]
MNENEDLTRSLGRELHGRVDGIHDAPIGLDQVKGAAGRIRRRRALTSGAAALAAVAIIVPAGLWGADMLPRGDESPPPATSTPSNVNPTDPPSSPETPEPPEFADEPIVINSDAPQGDDPRIAWVDAGVLHLPDGSTKILPKDYETLVRAGEEYVGIHGQSGGDDIRMDVLDADLNMVDSYDGYSAPVATADQTVAAWTDPAGTVWLRANSETREFAPIGRPASLRAIFGPDCASGGSQCRVYYDGNSDDLTPGAEGGAGAVGPQGPEQLPDGFINSGGISADGILVGLTSGSDHDPDVPTTSTLYDVVAGERIADLSDVRFAYAVWRPFSPDGRLVAGERLDPNLGSTPTGLQVFDVSSGQERVTIELGDDMPEGTTLQSGWWEDETHLLVMTVSPSDDGPGLYDLYRVGLDGTVERVGEAGYDNGTMNVPWRFVG